jgi:quercetin dioxygenase-like cupin family protein
MQTRSIRKKDFDNQRLISTHVKSDEILKAEAFALADTVQYVPDSVITKIIMLKATGTVKVLAFAAGTAVNDKTSPFDTFILVIDGTAVVTVQNKSSTLFTGQSIIIPAHALASIVAQVRFKIMSTIIKSGYEEVTIV